MGMEVSTSSATATVRSWQAVSNGIFQGNMPLDYALPLLIIQVTLVLLVTRVIGLLFKPLRQPRVLAEIIGGVLLGPTALGRNKQYMRKIFPEDSMTLLDTMANIGLLFFLFMVGLEVDIKEIRKSGKAALYLALVGIGLPFLGTLGVAFLVQKHLLPTTRFAPLVVFLGVPLSITAFPVLVRIMAERKLLKTELGRLVLPAAAINDVVAWVLLAVGVALSGPIHNPLTPLFVLLCGFVFGVFMLSLVRRFMAWVVKRNQESISEVYVAITLLSVLLCGFITDAIGIHPLFGAFVFGLIIPKQGTFGETIVQKLEDVVTILLIPLFFASSGLKTNLGTINSPFSLGFLLLFLATAAFGKITGSVAMARLAGRSDYRENLTLGFLMNTKGLAELIVLNIGKDLKILNDQLFAILVVMCLVTTFMTTPVVMALYKPARTPSPYTNRMLPNGKDKLRILACFHGSRNIPSLIALIQAKLGKKKANWLKVFAAELMELPERPSSILAASRSLKRDEAFAAFRTLAQLSKVVVRTVRLMSELADMHQDICALAVEKRVNIILLCHDQMEMLNPGMTGVNQRVLKHAPCSVAILVDRGFGETNTPCHIAVLFLGGPDDREALGFGALLADDPTITLTLIRFLQPATEEEHLTLNTESETEKASDKEAVELYRGHNYEEVITTKPVEVAETIAKSGRFCLLLVGRTTVAATPDLGLIGNALSTLSISETAHKERAIFPSILVVQQYNASCDLEQPYKVAPAIQINK